MPKLSIRDLDLKNKYVFIRVDFNVPLSEDGLQILDDTRIKETLPTLEYALRHHAKVIVASHLGAPQGQAKSQVQPSPRRGPPAYTARSRGGRVDQRSLLSRLCR